MKLYGFPFSPNTWKVRAVAAHLGLPVEDILVDLGKGEQRAPEYLSLNPTGRTPTLVDGDFKLGESYVYRVSATGYGASASTQVLLQTTVKALK